MAIIGKIRNNSWFILILLALALAAFLLMDVMGSNSVFGGAASQLNMGKVAGQKIDYTEFQRTEQALYSGSNDVYARRSSLWNYLIEKAIVNKEAEALGLGVSEDEIAELQFGTKLSPIIQNNFKNPQTGQVDRQRLQQVKQFMDSGEEMDPQFKLFWDEQTKQIEKTRIQEKYQSMVAKGLYTPTWQAEIMNQFNTENVSINYVKVPFDKIPDSEVTVSDEDIKAYITKNPAKYTNEEETRIIDYVVFSVLPTAGDTAVWKEEISSLVSDFQNTNEDSLFAVNNGGFYSFLYSEADKLQGEIKDHVAEMNIGDTYGPYVNNGAFIVGKMIDKRLVPDSVQARHILKNADPANPASMAAARSFIDSLKTRLVSGASSFDSLAINNSDDKGSGFKGGDLGYFTQGTMVPAFNNACFIGSKEGGLYTVATQFGIHLIEVTDLKYNNQDNKYNIAYIRTPIIPTQGTQEKIEDLAGELIGKNSGVAGFEEAIKGIPNVTINSSKELKANDFFIDAQLESGETTRDIIKWAFNKENNVGDVSPVIYTYTDLVNYYDNKYVVAGLKSVYAAGLKNIDVVRNNVELIVRNEKKGEILKSQMTNTDLDALAKQFSQNVIPTDNINFNSSYIPDLGPEPGIVAAAFKTNQGEVAGPIVGNSGVFMVKVSQKTPAVANGNVAELKRSNNNSIRSQVGFRLMNALKKLYKAEDKRSKFF